MHYHGSFQNRRQGACLDSSSGEAYTLGCNTGQYQEWDIRNISANLYYLKNRATGLRLDANSSNKAYPLSCNGGTNQRWTRVISSSMTDDELADTTLPFRVAKGEPEPPTVYAGLDLDRAYEDDRVGPVWLRWRHLIEQRLVPLFGPRPPAPYLDEDPAPMSEVCI